MCVSLMSFVALTSTVGKNPFCDTSEDKRKQKNFRELPCLSALVFRADIGILPPWSASTVKSMSWWAKQRRPRPKFLSF